ncbi:hypothetical protein GCM10023221_22190 [Luteimicrobium xylanilyticum]|uniref:Uncharacterized protein n=1 Tax=Luteimicrobium xylanilyticum TaxID=1133546 RepID=A0A5P9Q658_9MICO|nr:DUF5979 domain-containing protein [Luteimicrobium xylanilyticum]QFU96849.1 hypothetical protein KDY119_00339 [Luteimicrobium xylanilyticum]
MTKTRALIASILAFALALPLTVAGLVLAPAAEAVGGTLEVTKSVDNPGPYGPGDTMTFTIQVTCQSQPCAAAQLTDTLPAPLVLDGDDAIQVTTAGGGTYSTADSDGDGGTHVVVDATQEQSDGNPGMAPGTTATVSVQARVPDDATADNNGTVTNTANVSQDGGNSDSATADVTIDVPTTIDTTVTKDASPTSVPAVPGRDVSFTIHAQNTSNASVDSLVVSDPSDGGADPFQYLELTGISTFTPPEGADTVQVTWVDADGTSHTEDPLSPIPGDPSAILAGIPLDQVHGISFAFTGDGGIPIDGEATIVLETQTRDDVADLPEGTTTITNTASSDVAKGDDTATDDDDATVDVVSEAPTVTTSKEFADDHLLAGDSTTATIRSEVGSQPVTTMVIDEPTDGDANLADQGLTFGGFGGGVAWPAGADSVSIVYDYSDGTSSAPQTSTDRDTIPPVPAGHTDADVVGFHITFTSDDPDGIEPGDAATIPFDVTAQSVPGSDDVTSTNDTTTTVTDDTGESGTDEASDDVTRQPARIDTHVDKAFTPDEIPGVPGASTIVQIPASVCGQEQVDSGDCDTASTVGSDDLIISDPVEPSAGLTDFWNHMNVTSIGPMDIPEGSTLTVNYWDGDSWETLAGPIPAQSGWIYQVGSDPSPDDIQGLQFDFEPDPADGELPPGFEVLPYVTFQQRAELRDGSGSALPTEDTGPFTYTNDVESQVDNTDAIDTPVTDDDSADITVDPAEGGPGDTIDKGWVDPTTGDVEDTGVTVVALTDDERTARIRWGTHGFPMSQVQLSDVPSPATGDAVADTVYDAFDLVRIAPITTSTDPLIAFDQVSKVELFEASANGGAGGWVDVTGAACAAGCDGTFGGYTLTAAQQSDALSVRLTFVESPTRASRITAPTDPQVGTGVAQSAGNDRPVDLVFRIRQDMRVSGDPVLGNSPDNGNQPYNTGQDGLVSNTARMDGWAPATPTTSDPDYTDDDSATITILDRPVNVTTTKSFEEDTLGLPPEGTPQDEYPQDAMTLEARNTTEAKVRTMTIQDPDPGSNSNTFDVMNLNHVISITAPTGADASATEVFLTRGGTEDPAITADAALALGPSDLADVTGVRVVFHGFIDTTTDSTTPGGVVLSMQLRATHRDGGAAVTEADSVANTSFASVTSPEDTASDTAEDTVNIEEPTYGVDATKSIDPESRYEGDPNAYTVALTGKPTGTVRTTTLAITDDDPLFWNAFDFTGFPGQTVEAPIARVEVDALVGVTYSLDGDTLVQQCNGSDDLTACWVDGDFTAAGSPALPAGVAPGDVQGLRFTYDAGDGQPNWEHPSNPTAHATFSAAQRDNLRWSTDGENVTPVPSDLPTNELAPGETVLGRTNNTIQVHSEGSWEHEEGPWTADDDANDSTDYLHLPNSVTITKTPGDGEDPRDENPNSPIPYQFVVTNNGQWPQTGVTIVDTLPADGDGPQLVPESGDVPANGECADYPDAVIQLRGADGSTAPIAGASAQYCVGDDGTPEITVTLPDGFVLQPGSAIVVDTPLEYRGGTDPVAPGTDVVNSVTVSDDRVYDTCDSTHNASIDNPQAADVTTCTADTTTQPVALTPLRISKAVKGVGAGDPDVAEGDANYDDLGVLDVNANDENASGCQEPSVPNYEGDVIYYGESCVPITRPGGVERWQVRLTNAGNIPAHIVAGIDVLPTPGDTGVVVPTARGSEFRPRLIGRFTYDGQAVGEDTPMKLYYTTDSLDEACNEADIQNEITPGGLATDDPCYDDVTSRTWSQITSATPESQLFDATAIKAVLTYDEDNEGLGPGDDLALTFDTRTPNVAPTTSGDEPIAWNSVAEGAQGTFTDPDTGHQTFPVSLVTEPPKVGVAMATGQFDLHKAVVTPPGSDFPLPDSYTVQIACVSNGEPVPIVDENGDDKSVVTVPANGDVAVNDHADPATSAWSDVTIPWGAQCDAQEVPAPVGATIEYDPPAIVIPARSGTVEALRDYSDRTDIAHPIDTTSDDLNVITVRNIYRNAGFTVTKAVDNGGAEDQDGNPIAYDRDYTFTASCTFNDTEVVPPDDRTFTLHDGESKTVDGLPAGSTCTVTETDDGGAASTTTTTTTADGAGEPTDGTSSTFTLTADTVTGVTNTVAVENVYTVGSVQITKAVTGDGADDWGSGPFTVHMTCTLDGADPNPVFDADHTLTPPDDLTWSVDNLPTGAECTVTEPRTGGANGTFIDDPTFTVGDASDDPSIVTVTNTFTEGTVQVTKRIAGLDPESTEYQQALDATYTFSIQCTRVVDGVPTPVTIPGENPIQVTPSENPVGTWTGLPTGATCRVTEQFPDGGAPPLHLVLPRTVTVGDGTTVGAVGLNAFRVAPLTIVKEVDGDAADAAPDTFPVRIECFYGTGENRVALPVENADDNPGPVQEEIGPDQPFTTIDEPIGTECSVTEVDDGGATSTTITGSNVDADGNATIVPIPADGSDPEADTVTITNTFGATGFTVTKTVDDGGAKDQDGAAIDYPGPYTFSASCTFNGAEQLGPDDRTFEVVSGEAHTVTGVPVNSVCTVEETDAAGAPSTTVVITQSGDARDETTGTSSGSFVLRDGGTEVNAVAVTNHYTVGSVKVTKKLAGDGADAWGSGPFQVRLVCTLDGTDPAPVYDATHELKPGALTWTVDDLPTGAHCDVTEPRTGGATLSAISPADGITVPGPDDSPATAAITVTNTFDVGSIEVHKALEGDGAAGHRSDTFTVSLACTRDVDGTATAVKIPGGATRTVSATKDATYAGLPANATCTLTETKDGGSDATKIDPGTVTVPVGSSVAITVTNTFGAVPPSPTATQAGTGGLAGTGADLWHLGLLAAGVLALGLLVLFTALWTRRRE